VSASAPVGTPDASEQCADIQAKHKAGASISELSCLHGVLRPTVMQIARPVISDFVTPSRPSKDSEVLSTLKLFADFF
jgi:hypothetical protein